MVIFRAAVEENPVVSAIDESDIVPDVDSVVVFVVAVVSEVVSENKVVGSVLHDKMVAQVAASTVVVTAVSVSEAVVDTTAIVWTVLLFSPVVPVTVVSVSGDEEL